MRFYLCLGSKPVKKKQNKIIIKGTLLLFKGKKTLLMIRILHYGVSVICHNVFSSYEVDYIVQCLPVDTALSTNKENLRRCNQLVLKLCTLSLLARLARANPNDYGTH